MVALNRTKLLRFSKDLFGINDPSATDSEKSSMQFMAQACVEEMDLLAAQLSLEEKANAKSWGRSSQRFLGVLLESSSFLPYASQPKKMVFFGQLNGSYGVFMVFFSVFLQMLGQHQGLPLVTTLVKLLELGEVREADELRLRMKVADRRYWRMKIRGLASAGNFEELNAFAIAT